MRLKSRTWLLISLVLFGAAVLFWHWGDVEVAKRQHERALQNQKSTPTAPPPAVYNPILPAHTNAARTVARAFPYRLSNTTASLRELERNSRAILLRNALIDTTKPLDLNIPEKLKSGENPVTYIVQARGALDAGFYQALSQAGAQFVSYIPNNAALVSASADALAQLKSNAEIQSVLAYEPYYKLDSSLLPAAMGVEPLTNDFVGVTFFANSQEATRSKLEAMGMAIVGEDRTPFGQELYVRTHDLVALAREPGVMEIEPAVRRSLANDLARPVMNVASDPVVQTNYLGLTGSNVLVALNDSGVDKEHPDLAGRVFADSNAPTAWPWLLSDSNTNAYGFGHGTHVAGIIAGDGTKSTTVTNASGSPMPGTNSQFRGKAPGAKIFIQPVDLISGPLLSDAYLQETASKTNALISNNSWGYSGVNTYSMAAASYDAATRDSQPGVTGSQPLVYVFAAGNDGGGDDSGGNASSDSIESPGTGKNVITVGALESARNLTNQVAMNGTTNAIWAGETDSGSQVASFSSRGNVGIGVEGEFGRFKPDVVAPGVFVVSTRAQSFQDPVAGATLVTPYYPNLLAKAGQTNSLDVWVPDTGVLMAVQLYANAQSPVPFPTNLVILADSGTNAVTPRVGQFAVTSGQWRVGVFNPNQQPVSYDMGIFILVTNAYGNMFQVMSNMNATLGSAESPYNNGYYRYESGTSMAAPAVSGTLALIEEFFSSRLHCQPSPALVKALLINGARLSQGDLYDYQVARTSPNDEGWGVVNLTNSLPANWTTTNSGPTVFFDQSPDTALSTGQSCERDITLNPEAQTAPLRVTLVWTDPPGNPAAGIKLVNDLDLVVSNKDTGDVFVGNNFAAHSAYTQSNSNAPSDVVNNVENVYLDSSYQTLGSNYAVIVRAKRVNVNAVTAHTNGIVQDFALVISSTCTTSAAPFSVSAPINSTNTTPWVMGVTNGVPLLYQRVGANSPLIGGQYGTTNQWRFFTFTNNYPTNADGTISSNTPYVALFTFMPPNLSTPRNYDADIDMYASTNSGLLSLDAGVMAWADRSVQRGGNERLLYSNSVSGTVYYIGVKSEDAKAAEFGFMAVASGDPFSSTDANGNLVIRAIPLPVALVDGTPQKPQSSLMFFVPAGDPATIRRLTVQEQITHQYLGDLYGVLKGGSKSVVLNNHSNHGTNLVVFDDSGEVTNAISSDGPGSLRDFMGDNSSQNWQFTLWDNAAAHDGVVSNLSLVIAPRPADPYDFYVTLPANGTYFDYIDVPTDATNLNIAVAYASGDSKVDISIREGDLPPPADYSTNGITPPGGSLNVSITNTPVPLAGGRWFYELHNEGDGGMDNGSVTLHVIIRIDRSMTPDLVKTFTSTNASSTLSDDALTSYSIYVPDSQPVLATQVGVRLDHPRVSDLALTLTSPQGTRVMLFEDRGGTNATALGFGTNGDYVYTIFTEDTNMFPQVIKFAQPPYGSTNDTMTTNMLVFDSGFETNPAWNFVATNYGTTNALVGVYTNGQTVDGWTVVSNQFSSNIVTVVQDPFSAFQGSNYFALGAGNLVRTVDTVPGRSYRLSYAYRSPGITNWWPGDAKPNDLIGGANGTGNVQYTNGVVDNAFSFNGGSRVTLNAGNFGTSDFSVDFWIQTSAARAQPVLNDGALSITASAAGGVSAMVSAGVTVTTGPITDGAFHHVAVVRHQTTLAIYLDGKPIQAVEVFAIVPILSSDAFLGNQGFIGQIDELDFFNRALSPAEVWAIYQAGAAGKYSSFSPMPNAEFVINGLTNSVHGNDPAWQTNMIVFEADSTATMIELKGSAMSPVFDEIKLEQLAYTNYANYFLAEEGLDVFKGENALGSWTLGIWDTRTGAASTNTQLMSWNLQLTYSSTNVDLNTLTNGGYSTNTVPGLQTVTANTGSKKALLTSQVGATNIVYFAIDVPINASRATNYIETLDPHPSDALNLLYSATGLPTGDLPGDAVLISGQSVGQYILTKGTPPFLVPGQRYFLGVQNLNSVPETFRLRVDFDVATSFNIMPLTNGVEFTTNTVAGNGIQYYSFDVSPISSLAMFEVYGMTNGDVDIVVSKDLPPPTPQNFDYISSNPGTNSEAISIQANSSPVPLSPGQWYLGVYNYGGTAANYTVRASEWNTTLIDLTNNIPYTGTVSSNYLAYFAVDVPAWTVGVSNILSTTGNLQLVFNQNQPPQSGDAVLANTNYLSATSTPVLQPGKRYYLWVRNPNPTTPQDFTIKVQFVNPTNNNLVQLTNAVSFNATVASNSVNYYRFTVPTNLVPEKAHFEVFNLSGNADLAVRYGLPLPDPYYYDYISTNSGTTPELIEVTTNSPVPLASGDWYLTVYNSDSAPVSYSVRATEWALSTNLIVLTNQIPYTNSVAAGTVQYFAVDVPSDAFSVTNTVNANGPLSLLWSEVGLPTGTLPGDATLMNQLNGVTNLLTSNSIPALLTGQRYYMTLTNSGAQARQYTIEADYGVSITPLTNGVDCDTNLSGFNVTKYYSFDVTTNAARVSFDLFNLSGNLDLVARLGQPLPNALSFDYQSTNGGTTNDTIVLSNSAPVTLAAGHWYLGVYDPTGTNNVTYTVRATEWGNPGTNFIVVTNGTNFTYTVPSNSVVYFAIDVPTNAAFATNLLNSLNPTNSLSLLYSQFGLPTGKLPSDYLLLQNVTIGTAVLGTNGPGASMLPGQRYYVGITNANGANVQFSFEVDFGYPPALIPLTDGIAYNAINSEAPQFYSFQVDSNAVAASFELRNLSGNVDLVVRRRLPLPTFYNYDYSSENPGTNNEAVVVLTNSMPALTPGLWYLGVYNNDSGPVGYTVLAKEALSSGPSAPHVIPLVDGVPWSNAVAGVGTAFDNAGRFTYYQFTITNNGPAVAFTLNDPGTNVDLIAQQGGFPTPQIFSGGVIGAGLGTEILVFATNDSMPSLNGDWYLAVPNNSSAPATFDIAATLLPIGSLDPILYNLTTTNGFGFNWTTVPFLPYSVDLSTNLPDFVEVTNSVATSTNLYFNDAVTNGQSMRFYRVRELQMP